MPKIRMKQRTIRETWWWDRNHIDMSSVARLLWIGLACMSDDYGFVQINKRYIALQCFPFDDDPLPMINSGLDELIVNDTLVPYQIDGTDYARIRRFDKFIVLRRRSTVRNPVPEGMKYGKKPKKKVPVPAAEPEVEDDGYVVTSEERSKQTPDELFPDETVAPPVPVEPKKDPVAKAIAKFQRQSPADDLREFGAQINTRYDRGQWDAIIKRYGMADVEKAVTDVAAQNEGKAGLPQVTQSLLVAKGCDAELAIPRIVQRINDPYYMEKVVEIARQIGITPGELPHFCENRADARVLKNIAATLGL